MVRKLLKSSIGVALGGGAAFGIAHLGVLRVLEQNGVPVDLVAGCSQGSIIGVGYAAGVSTEEMISIARDLGRKRNFFKAMDFTITRPGILAGNRIMEIFSPLLGEKKTFEDLVVPCRTIATDIESGERVAIGTGRLDSAFRASSAVPMVISPLRWGERALVDGGVSDPVPAETVTQMGADLCIAVNVVPPLKRGIETVMSRAYRQLNRLNPLSYLGESQELPNLFDIVMNSMQILQYELGNFKAISADILINPDLTDFTWIEYYRAEELIQRGIEAAEKAMPAIRKAIDERLAPLRKLANAKTETAA
jgi:NTE family protein